MRRFSLCVLLLVAVAAQQAAGATIRVMKDGSGDFTVIQAALDVAAAGDTILIGPGEYLEHSTVRLPGWSWDIESYANVMVDDLTIIGAGADQTIIGPPVYSGSYSSGSPKVVTYREDGDLTLAAVSLRNSHSGVHSNGRLLIDDCDFIDNYTNLSWTPAGSGGWIRNCQFDVWTPSSPVAIAIRNWGGASDILVENCTVRHALTLVDGVQGITFRGCDFSDTQLGMQAYGGAHVFIDQCEFTNLSVSAVELSLGSGSVCEITDSDLAGGQATLAALWPDCRFVVRTSRIVGGAYAALFADTGAGASQVSDCDLVKGAGPAVRCGLGGSPVTHDLRNNYWGTTDEATIRSWIIDHDDNPAIAATVLYSPFAGQSVPAEATSWGELKALFR